MIKDFITRIRYKINPKYKDKVFCFVFGDPRFKKNALSLYNAVNGTNYIDENDLIIYTLADVIYIKMKNDVSYLFHDIIALYEQQSSINPNMPIRGLMYFAEMYSKFISTNKLNLYGEKLIKIPNPQYIVFYNGEKEYKGPEKLKLSDSFQKEDASGEYEWTATVVNMNDINNPIRSKCSTLNDYMLLIEKIRMYNKSMSLQDAVDKAIDECIEEERLTDVLSEFKAEVRKMCITEFDEKVYTEGIRSEGFEQGQMFVFKVQDYIKANPTASDADVAITLNCSENVVKEARKRIQ